MILVFALIVLVIGSVVFHLLSPWWFTPIASNWGYIDDTIVITFWITGVAFVAIIMFMAYCLLRFRHQTGTRAAYEPENKRLEWWLTVLTSLGVAGLLTPGLFVWNQFITVPAGADTIEVMGQQWQFNFRLPGKDGVLGTSDTRNVTPENPFGLNPNDPNGQDDVLIAAQDLHLPLNRPVKVLLRSIDTLHDFYVPQFRAKMDMVPGMVTYFWFTPTRAGTFESICAELCGTGHYTMRAVVVVDEENAYQAWLQEQSTFKQSLADPRNGTADKLSLVSGESEIGSAEGASGR
jgi:cytochrome c oxidase subunit II